MSTSAIMKLIEASKPANSIPAALRTVLFPPSHPTRYAPRSVEPSESSTSTPVSSWLNPIASLPMSTGTPSSSIQPARMRSKWLCHSARP